MIKQCCPLGSVCLGIKKDSHCQFFSSDYNFFTKITKCTFNYMNFSILTSPHKLMAAVSRGNSTLICQFKMYMTHQICQLVSDVLFANRSTAVNKVTVGWYQRLVDIGASFTNNVFDSSESYCNRCIVF